jgi:hypothetical protein
MYYYEKYLKYKKKYTILKGGVSFVVAQDTSILETIQTNYNKYIINMLFPDSDNCFFLETRHQNVIDFIDPLSGIAKGINELFSHRRIAQEGGNEKTNKSLEYNLHKLSQSQINLLEYIGDIQDIAKQSDSYLFNLYFMNKQIVTSIKNFKIELLFETIFMSKKHLHIDNIINLKNNNTSLMFYYNNPIIHEFDKATDYIVGDHVIINKIMEFKIKAINENKKIVTFISYNNSSDDNSPINKYNFPYELDNKLDSIIIDEYSDIFRINDLVKINNDIYKIINITEMEINKNISYTITLFNLKTKTNLELTSIFESSYNLNNIKKIKIYPFTKIIYYNDNTNIMIKSTIKNNNNTNIFLEKLYIPEFDLLERINYLKLRITEINSEKINSDFQKLLFNFLNMYIEYLECVFELTIIEFPSTLGLYFDNLSEKYENPENYQNLLMDTNIYSEIILDKFKISDEKHRILLSSKKKTIMILGAGPIGLITALKFRKYFPDVNIIIIETRNINLFRKSKYTRFQQIDFNDNIFEEYINQYLKPLMIRIDERTYSISIELRVIETILLYFCMKSNIILHNENKNYKIDDLIKKINPIILINSSGKQNIDSDIIKLEPTDWLDRDGKIKTKCNIEKINNILNVYRINYKLPFYVKYDANTNNYIYCNEDGTNVSLWFIYLKISKTSSNKEDVDKLKQLSNNKLIALKDIYNLTVKITDFKIIQEINDIFKKVNINILTSEIPEFHAVFSLLIQQFNIIDENNKFEEICIPLINSITISNIFNVDIQFAATSSTITQHNDKKFLYLLMGDSHTKDFYYSGQGTNKWITMIEKFILSCKQNKDIFPYLNN